MKLVKKHLLAATVAALCCAAAAPAPAAPPAALDFARAAALDSVVISPDGKHIAALSSPDGQNVNISVWETAALGKPPVVIGSTRMRFLSVDFLKNDRLVVNAIQTYTMGSTKTHLVKQFITDLGGSNFRPLLPAAGKQSEDEAFVNALRDAQIIDRLPLDPRHVLALDERLGGEGDLYKIDVYTGDAERLMRGSERVFDDVTDLKGEVRARTKFDYENGSVYFAQLLKNPDTGQWDEHFRWYAKDREPMEVVGFDVDPNIAYIASARGSDKTGIFAYDIRARKILEPLFEHKMFNAGGILTSKAASDYGRILGFTYMAETPHIYWVDEALGAQAKGLRNALDVTTHTIDWVDPGTGAKAKISTPDNADARISDWSDDRTLAIVEKSGGGYPPEYYLMSSDGKLAKLGASRPWMDLAALGSTRLVEYAARDGLLIPGFLTTPPESAYGKGPYPTLILPHGGPWARDYMDWDISGWTQYFAARGFAVLQPQFRGSEGWGQKLWRAGDGEWGQKMQDDKDDGAKWLIAQKVADPNRIAMFGYSYGGYAALAAAIRPNGLYQCAISGAGAGDLASLKRATFENRYQRDFQNPTIAGLDALAHAREVSIPILLYHGDRDQIVEIKQSKEFAKELKAAGKPYKFVEIKDMGHQYMTMTPAMLEQQLVEIETFLRNDCGPGGL